MFAPPRMWEISLEEDSLDVKEGYFKVDCIGKIVPYKSVEEGTYCSSDHETCSPKLATTHFDNEES